MTRRIGTWMVTLLVGCALSGCALRPQTSSQGLGVAKVQETPRTDSPPVLATGPVSASQAPSSTAILDVPPPAAGFAPVQIQQTAQAQEVQEKQKPAPANMPLIHIPEAKPLDNKSQAPALLALQDMIENRHSQAVDHLRAYDPKTQEFFLRMLPVMSMIAKTPLSQLSPNQVSMIVDEFGRVQSDLRPMTGVSLGAVCFCEWVKAYGNYNPLPEDYVFAAGTSTKAGELVHLYVELKHFGSVQRAKDRYETVLASSLEIRNAQGRLVRSLEFGDEKTPLTSRTPLNDYFKNYTFAIPDLVPGVYQMKIIVRDETLRATPRTAEKTLDIRVGPQR